MGYTASFSMPIPKYEYFASLINDVIYLNNSELKVFKIRPQRNVKIQGDFGILVENRHFTDPPCSDIVKLETEPYRVHQSLTNGGIYPSYLFEISVFTEPLEEEREECERLYGSLGKKHCSITLHQHSRPTYDGSNRFQLGFYLNHLDEQRMYSIPEEELKESSRKFIRSTLLDLFLGNKESLDERFPSIALCY